jgi:dynein assembly factor 1
MPSLAVLYLTGNPVCKKIANYRKTIIAAIPTLKYLDDRPVFEDDRIYAEAFARGGITEEREARKEWNR